MEERVLDVRGKACPQPVVETRRALGEMTGGVLVVLLDNETSSRNVTDFATRAGHEVAREDTGGGQYVVRFAPAAGAQETPASGAGCAAPTKTTTAVALFSPTMGRGNEELGQILIRSFLYTLAESASPPHRVLCANRGVELCCEGSPVLDHLRTLEHRGAEVIACGTCLDFLQLKEKLAVGRVGSMQEIVEALTQAGKVIAP